MASRIAEKVRTMFGRPSSPRAKANEGLRKDSPLRLAPGETSIFPKSSQEAHERLHWILDQQSRLVEVSHEEFMLAWASIAYIAPGLDPDEATLEEGGWPFGWRAVAREAFRRFKAKKLTKAELYLNPPNIF